MFKVWVRFLLIITAYAIGGYTHLRLGFGQAWFLYLAGTLLLLTYLLFGNVWAAFTLLRRGRQQEAARVLSFIFLPKLLLPVSRAYFYFCMGMIAVQDKRLESAAAYLKKSLKIGLRTPTDNALASLNLAHIYWVKNDETASAYWLEYAQQFPTNDLMIQDHLKRLEKTLI